MEVGVVFGSFSGNSTLRELTTNRTLTAMILAHESRPL